ncbi:MAG: GIY-YIG nuclease family protein [Planctomycetota bacterium]|nr:GIY-YIG nuclease family protein [Planctomycetota bacterium]
MDDGLARLVDVGFKIAGSWNLDGDGIACDMNDLAAARNVLYAFAVDGELVYVGKTVQPLRARMTGYRNPAPTQSTNIKNNSNIRQCLAHGKRVEIYVLPDNGLLHYGKFHVNLAAGLEDSVVRELNPPWNGGQKEATNQTLQPTEAG